MNPSTPETRVYYVTNGHIPPAIHFNADPRVLGPYRYPIKMIGVDEYNSGVWRRVEGYVGRNSDDASTPIERRQRSGSYTFGIDSCIGVALFVDDPAAHKVGSRLVHVSSDVALDVPGALHTILGDIVVRGAVRVATMMLTEHNERRQELIEATTVELLHLGVSTDAIRIGIDQRGGPSKLAVNDAGQIGTWQGPPPS